MSDYPLISELCIPIQKNAKGDDFCCYFTDVHALISKALGRRAVAKFSTLFGVQTCTEHNGKAAGYCWDIERALKQLATTRIKQGE